MTTSGLCKHCGEDWVRWACNACGLPIGACCNRCGPDGEAICGRCASDDENKRWARARREDERDRRLTAWQARRART